MTNRTTERNPWTVRVAVVGTTAVVAYAVVAVLQVLVLNPLSAVPGRPLGQIYADVEAAGESMHVGFVIFVLALGPAIGVALLRRARESSRLVVAGWYLTLVAFGAPAYFWASFGPGMAIADTYLIGGGDSSAWGYVLYASSGLAMVALLAVAAGRMKGHEPSKSARSTGRTGGI